MKAWDGETRRNTLTPFVLVVGASQGFVARCRSPVPDDVLVGGASVDNYPKQAARLRPHVVVVTSAVRAAFDDERFDDLARAVGAQVVCVADETASDGELSQGILEAFDAVARKRDSWSRE